jgi:hypothetical protein
MSHVHVMVIKHPNLNHNIKKSKNFIIPQILNILEIKLINNC